jgi:hypothetical protein
MVLEQAIKTFASWEADAYHQRLALDNVISTNWLLCHLNSVFLAYEFHRCFIVYTTI